MTRTLRVIGVGLGPAHLTDEARGALRASGFVVAARKRGDDPLLAARAALCADHGVPLVAVDDPVRDPDPADYPAEVRRWHAAREEGWIAAITSRDGDPALLAWGDPALYDSTVRLAHGLVERLDARLVVVPGISAPSALAAAHGIVLHEVGEPVHVTTERRLPDALAAGQRNVVVMLTSGALPTADLGLEGWRIWWGANLGSPSQRLRHGVLAEQRAAILADREAARRDAGWVMDAYLLRAPR